MHNKIMNIIKAKKENKAEMAIIDQERNEASSPSTVFEHGFRHQESMRYSPLSSSFHSISKIKRKQYNIPSEVPKWMANY